MKWMAHDGVSGRAPDCLLASLRAAWTLGVEVLVVDLVLTADDRVIVASPALLQRIGAACPPSTPTLGELRRHDPGRGFVGRFQTPAGVVQGTDEPWIRHGNQPQWTLATLDERYGSVRGFLTGPAGVDPATIERLREILLV